VGSKDNSSRLVKSTDKSDRELSENLLIELERSTERDQYEQDVEQECTFNSLWVASASTDLTIQTGPLVRKKPVSEGGVPTISTSSKTAYPSPKITPRVNSDYDDNPVSPLPSVKFNTRTAQKSFQSRGSDQSSANSDIRRRRRSRSVPSIMAEQNLPKVVPYPEEPLSSPKKRGKSDTTDNKSGLDPHKIGCAENITKREEKSHNQLQTPKKFTHKRSLIDFGKVVTNTANVLSSPTWKKSDGNTINNKEYSSEKDHPISFQKDRARTPPMAHEHNQSEKKPSKSNFDKEHKKN